MIKSKSQTMNPTSRKKWFFLLFSALLLSLLIFLTAISTLNSWSNKPILTTNRGPQFPPSFAYYISGSHMEKEQIFRLLLAVYHPRNTYLLHLSMEASDYDREWLVESVRKVPAIKAFGNVHVIGKPLWLTHMGATNIAAILRGASILMKVDDGWDWFINLSACDYPLITQDDLAHVFSSFKRDLNFIDHTSELGWKEDARIHPIIVDPSIYLARRSQIFTATQKRPTPAAFKVFTGSPWVTLSRSFLEYSLFGWDNLPRTVLMYFNNAILPQEGYFHSVICNSPEFMNTTINTDMRFMMWDSPPKMEPHFLCPSDFDQMVQSGAAFARQFRKDDPVLTMIDERILHRRHNRVVPGSWCSGRDSWFSDACAQWSGINSLKPGLQAKRFADSMTNHVDDVNSKSTQCQ